MMPMRTLRPHRHRLTSCSCTGGLDANGDPCAGCGGRGYYEVCTVCGEPMGNARRRWKRERHT